MALADEDGDLGGRGRLDDDGNAGVTAAVQP